MSTNVYYLCTYLYVYTILLHNMFFLPLSPVSHHICSHSGFLKSHPLYIPPSFVAGAKPEQYTISAWVTGEKAKLTFEETHLYLPKLPTLSSILHQRASTPLRRSAHYHFINTSLRMQTIIVPVLIVINVFIRFPLL